MQTTILIILIAAAFALLVSLTVGLFVRSHVLAPLTGAWPTPTPSKTP